MWITARGVECLALIRETKWMDHFTYGIVDIFGNRVVYQKYLIEFYSVRYESKIPIRMHCNGLEWLTIRLTTYDAVLLVTVLVLWGCDRVWTKIGYKSSFTLFNVPFCWWYVSHDNDWSASLSTHLIYKSFLFDHFHIFIVFLYADHHEVAYNQFKASCRNFQRILRSRYLSDKRQVEHLLEVMDRLSTCNTLHLQIRGSCCRLLGAHVSTSLQRKIMCWTGGTSSCCGLTC